MRRAFLLLHRYVGLALAGFLVIIGLTGSVIVFFNELDAWANPELLKVAALGQPMDVLALREKLEAEDPRSHVYGVHFPEHADEAFSAYVEGAIDPATGEPHVVGYDQLYANPYTGERLGQRMWGDISLKRKDLTTFIYFLHYSLVLPEALGEGFMGIVALIWAFDCFVGFYLTLPRRRRAPARPMAAMQGFWRRWKPAWLIKAGAGPHRLNFDWHRASGLWLWPMLLVFAISGFAFNLPRTYEAVMSRLTHYVDNDVQPKLDRPLSNPAVGWRQALALGREYMTEQAAVHGFTIDRPASLIYRRETGVYDYRVHSSRDLVQYGYTSIVVDATTGVLRGVDLPTGQHAGSTFTSWIKALHQAMVFGLPYRLLVSTIGLLVAALAVTGIVVWWRKHAARDRVKARAAAPAE